MSQPSPVTELPEELREGDLIADAVARGLVTADEVRACQEERLRQARQDIYRPLSAYLIESQALTPGQWSRLVAEHQQRNHIDELPGYKLLEQLGQGSMGTVFLARHLKLDRLVALKVLSRRFGRNRHYVDSLLREAQLAASLESAYWPRVYDIGSYRGQHYYVMEYVNGDSIEALLQARGRLSEVHCIRIAAEACVALQHLHQLDILHRDIKPHNIVISRSGQLKCVDLGLSRRVRDEELIDRERGAAIGTPLYIPPEQVAGSRDITARADLYGLGATLYHMLTGTPPFPRGKTEDLFEAHLKRDPEPPRALVPELTPGMEDLVLQLLRKDPLKRPASAGAVRGRLLALLGQKRAATEDLLDLLPS